MLWTFLHEAFVQMFAVSRSTAYTIPPEVTDSPWPHRPDSFNFKASSSVLSNVEPFSSGPRGEINFNWMQLAGVYV